MKKNPYKFRGPLDIDKDKLVLVTRTHDLDRVCEGIENGEYWAILGPRQIGHTTFLRQIIKKMENIFHLDIDFQVCPNKEEHFYQWLLREFIERIPTDHNKDMSKKWIEVNSASKLLGFLKEFKPKNDIKKILLLFDEIEDIPGLATFLHIWRKIYNSRDAELKKRYTVIIAGANELVSLTEGKTSPFNIADKLYMKDFSQEESRHLIEEPFAELNIRINYYAKEKLLSQINGHPQLLQHSCSLLVDTANREARGILEKDVDEVVNTLLKTNDSIATLNKDVVENSDLNTLIKNIFESKKILYHLKKEFSTKGAGCIVEDNNGNCAIRNKVYEKFLRDFFHIPFETVEDIKPLDPNSGSDQNKEKRVVFICYSRKDERWKDKLLKQLKVLESQGMCITWNDENIPAGEQWFDEIKKNLIQAKAAIILITANSLSSDFILHEEIPELLEKKEKEGILIIPVWVEHCNWESVKWLKRMQMLPRDGKPIDGRSTAKQDEIFSEIAKLIADYFENLNKQK